MRIVKLTQKERENILENLLKRSPNQYSKFETTVRDILDKVKAEGDQALFAYTEQFDGVKITEETFRVTEEEIAEAYEKVDSHLIEIIRKALVNIRDYHQKQVRYSWFDSKPDGTLLGQKVTALERVGVYVPGGKAAYPSSVLMNIMPANVAGVEEIIMTTPPSAEGKINPTTIVAADIAGVHKIYKAGGAQAVAALAFGTESIPKVDKIVGPGNIFVALAKRSVYGYVNIDSVAGPSEILILADESANPVYVAADLLSQAEHDELASAVLITTSESLANEVQKEVEKQTAVLERKGIIEKSLDNYGAIILVKDFDEATTLSNAIAPEHMEVCIKEPFGLLPKIQNAGAIFLGHFTPEPLGDYMAGPNHVLPTNGTAKFFSPLSVDDFIKKSSIIYYSREALEEVHEDIEKIEDDIKILFPEAAVARMDLDTTRTRSAYEKIIADFEQGKTDILIGTQMVSKGLDFDHVSIVGILNADTMLNYPDFRSYERAFQLMAQVAGRAGRKNKRGRVILQTKSIDHPIIHQVIANDYEDMVGGQLAERQMFHYPPYYRLVYVYLKNHNESLLDQMAAVMAGKLRAVFGNRVLGPDKPPVARIQTLFIKKIVVKIEQNAPMGRARELLLRIQREMIEDERYKSLIVYYDVDPM